MTSLFEDLNEDVAPEALAEMGSFNHGYLQLKIGSHFLNLPDFTPSSEFSLDTSTLSELELSDISGTLKPDIAVYDQWSVDFQNDVLQAQRMPILAIEILSPMQDVKTLVDKFKAYFALGVRSCWLVYPYAEAISVYHASSNFKLFAQGDVVDDIVGVRVALSEIFS